MKKQKIQKDINREEFNSAFSYVLSEHIKLRNSVNYLNFKTPLFLKRHSMKKFLITFNWNPSQQTHILKMRNKVKHQVYNLKKRKLWKKQQCFPYYMNLFGIISKHLSESLKRIELTHDNTPSNYCYLFIVGSRAKRWISKRMLQENKTR